MATVNKIQDVEVRKQEKNLTDAQKKNIEATKEGVVVNSLIKSPNINYLYDSLVISDDAKMPKKLKEDKTTKDKSLAPLSFIAVGVMGTMALISALIRKSAKVNLSLGPEKKLEHLTRNVSITDESIQGIYQMVQCPNQKTILAGTGVIVLSAMGFMGKMFMDGFKDIWVKKREADIQKNLQENLIAVETQSFSGKIQIIRSMLADKAREFNEYLCINPNTPACKCPNEKVYFTGNEKSQNQNESNPLKYFAMGALTLGAILGLGFLSLKNLGKGKTHLEEYIHLTKKEISEIIAKSNDKTKQVDIINLKNMFEAIDSSPDYIRSQLSKLKWEDKEKNNFIDDVIFNTTKSTTKADRAIGGDGTPKPAFNSYVNDYRAFFYNYLLDRGNPQFATLFWSITGLTALSYGGKVLGEAVKDVQVKKMNAETELNLQKRLVATELRNFKAKKDAAIEPLCDEFYTQLDNGKPKEELQTIAENILFEVKNGPPFVYS